MLQTHLSKIVGLTGLLLLTAITLISKNSFAMQVKSGGLEEEAALIGELGVRFGIPATSIRRITCRCLVEVSPVVLVYPAI